MNLIMLCFALAQQPLWSIIVTNASGVKNFIPINKGSRFVLPPCLID
ncbi:conserved hypothetical protein [Calderihabitans maritimus]|uniref:Uncharacterized protein n=1 Tax=Calderihabitans maritimus TaxID=1246530 RepID=A0A1Z5HNS2_9FIRM|nr:conserved hypothetical protein [Calderihabitans maritimus]